MDRYQSSLHQFQPNAAVIARDGELGRLVQLPNAGVSDNDVLTVALHGSDREVEVPMSVVDLAASSVHRVQLTVPIAAISGAEPANAPSAAEQLTGGTETLTVPLSEEELSARTRERDLGNVRFEKRVETRPAEVTTDIGHEDVTVERVAINQPIDATPESRFEGDTLIIPVVEEVLVTEKRLMLREEVHIRRQWVTESVTVEDTVRREVLDVEDRTD